MKTYKELEEQLGISPYSPESYYAEIAWNAALKNVVELTKTKSDVGEIVSVLEGSISEFGMIDVNKESHEN